MSRRFCMFHHAFLQQGGRLCARSASCVSILAFGASSRLLACARFKSRIALRCSCLTDRPALPTGCYLLHHYGGVYLDVCSLDTTGHSWTLHTSWNLFQPALFGFTSKVDTICLQSLEGLYDLIESNQCDAVGWNLRQGGGKLQSVRALHPYTVNYVQFDQHIVYVWMLWYDMILVEVCGSADAKWPKWEECHSELLLRVWWSSMGWTHRGVGIPGIIGDGRWWNPAMTERWESISRQSWYPFSHGKIFDSVFWFSFWKFFGPPGHGSIPPTLWPYRAVAVDRDGLIGLATWCIIHENSWFESSMYVEVQCTAWQTWGKAPSHNEPKDTWKVGQHTFVKRIQIWFLKENRKMHLQCIGCSCCSSLQGQMYSTGRTLHHAATLGLTNISSPQTLRTGDFARCLRSSNSCPQSASEQGAEIRFWKCQVSETPPKRGWQALIANNPEKDHLTICRHTHTHWRSSFRQK